MNNRQPWAWRMVHRFFTLCIVSGLILMAISLFYSQIETVWIKSQIAQSHQNLSILLEALQAYTVENPRSVVFIPDLPQRETGIFLCPLQEASTSSLAFLTTPVAYLTTIPSDPFLQQAYGSPDGESVAMILRWFRRDAGTDEITHIGWGAFSVGPTLQLPPSFSVSHIQSIPRLVAPARRMFYHPTNGLRSMGILYRDSLGNVSGI